MDTSIPNCLAVAIMIAIAFLPNAHGATMHSGLKHVPINADYLRGTWKVTNVGLRQQATPRFENAPAYSGAMLSFSAMAIAWHVDPTNKKGLYRDCNKPSFVPSTQDQASSYAVICDATPWGVGATFKVINQNTLLLNWYDDVLTLSRQ